MKTDSHDLDDFMQAATDKMASDYARIQKRVGEDTGTAGDQGEENWAQLLRDWLPSSYHIETKGRVLSHEGLASPQMDVLVLYQGYPKRLLGEKHYLAGGVAAAFECKTTLRAEHITDAVQNAVKLRQLLPKRSGTPYQELNSPIIYGLLAHSHSWARPRSTPVENVTNQLLAKDRQFVQHPRQMLDFLCIADLACWVAGKDTWVGGTNFVPEWPKSPFAEFYGPNGAPSTSYARFVERDQVLKTGFAPIGTLIACLLYKLAWEDPALRRLARYFFEANVPGHGYGSPRVWEDSIYSEKVRAEVASGRVVYSENSWDEWRYRVG